ncbi:MAG: hypothetical protein IPO00_15235 [Betaproteobacteria bacterium]|nr:hypothetical protein [Betaproteobacteria bacterium]
MSNKRNVDYEELVSRAVDTKTNLPMEPKVRFSKADDDPRHLVLTLSDAAACENMQTNSAAFESWLIALKAWNVIEKATLSWDVPTSVEPHKTRWCHYQRFLYRVSHFNLLFGDDWFAIDDKNKGQLEECLALNEHYRKGGDLILNVPDKDGHKDPVASKHEAGLENGFGSEGKVGYTQLAEKFKLRSINRQLPVGLFKKEKSRDSRIFTGGSSAIDLVGIGKDESLWIFELKKAGNHSIGIISELMFYAACMRDLRRGSFVLHSERAGKRWVGDIKDIAVDKKVNAVFLAPTLHPLFAAKLKECLALLNGACTKAQAGIEYHYQRFKYDEEGGVPVGIKLEEID